MVCLRKHVYEPKNFPYIALPDGVTAFYSFFLFLPLHKNRKTPDMKSIFSIIKTTLSGGLFFLVPVALFVIIIAKVFTVLQKILNPIVQRFPNTDLVGTRVLQQLGAILILLLICFAAGLVAKTKAAQNSVSWIEDSILGLVPGYKFIKSMGKTVTGLEEQEMNIVLARVDDGWQLSFLIEQIDDNMYTVFVPDAPHPWSGSVYHMEKDKIIWTNITKRQALNCLRQLGMGSVNILKDKFDSKGKLPSEQTNEL
jgi:uncharacterized membrane protein